MADYFDNVPAFIICNTYGFNPPRKVYSARRRDVNTGKFEPDCRANMDDRTFTFAHYQDKTNVLIKFEPANLVP